MYKYEGVSKGNDMKKITLITGATSGFGEATAHRFAQSGHSLLITGRRKEKLIALQKTLSDKYSVAVHSLCFDVQNKEAVQEAIQSLPAEWKKIEILVNNAGLGLGLSTIDQGSVEEWETMIDTNLKGLLYVSHAVIPLMIQNKKGHIINLGSAAAKDVYPKGNVYCATKAAVDSLSKGMRIDLLPHRIKVTAIHPGAAETEFSLVRFNGDAAKAKAIYSGYQPLSADDVAEVIHYCGSLPDHMCINDLVLTCTAQANTVFFQR
jgi:3-hydroxy acid dehydrogenase/malonic semialdehyde reductase